MNTTSISPYVVETDGLSKRFGERTVVRDVDLRVPRGSAFGYLGPNGARTFPQLDAIPAPEPF